MRSYLPLLTLVCLVAGVAPESALAQDRQSPLRLAPGDRVRIEIAGDSTLSGDFDVDVTGHVLVPLVGLVAVADRPFPQVAEQLQAGFRGELVDVPVRVLPLVRIPVLGEVNQPGIFWVDETMTLSEVLAVAGGLSESAKRSDIRVQRNGGDLVHSADEPEPVLLVPRDRVFVGHRGFLSENASLFIGAGASVLAALVTSLILR